MSLSIRIVSPPTRHATTEFFERLSQYSRDTDHFLPDDTEQPIHYGDADWIIGTSLRQFEARGANAIGVRRAVYLAICASENHPDLSPFTRETTSVFTAAKLAKLGIARLLIFSGITTTLFTLLPAAPAAIPALSQLTKNSDVGNILMQLFSTLSPPLCNFLNWIATGTRPYKLSTSVDAAQHSFSQIQRIFAQIAANILLLSHQEPQVARRILESIDMAILQRKIAQYFVKGDIAARTIFVESCSAPLRQVRQIVLDNSGQQLSGSIKLLHAALISERWATERGATVSTRCEELYTTLYDALTRLPYLPTGLDDITVPPAMLRWDSLLEIVQLTYLAGVYQGAGLIPLPRQSVALLQLIDRANQVARKYLLYGGLFSVVCTIFPLFTTLIPSWWQWTQESTDNDRLSSIVNASILGGANALNFICTGPIPDRRSHVVAEGQHHYRELKKLFDNLAVTLIQLRKQKPAFAMAIANAIHPDRLLEKMMRYSYKGNVASDRMFFHNCIGSLGAAIHCVQRGYLPETPPSPAIVLAFDQFLAAPISIDSRMLSFTILANTIVLFFRGLVDEKYFRWQTDAIALEQASPQVRTMLRQLIREGIHLAQLARLIHLTRIGENGARAACPFHRNAVAAFRKVRQTQTHVSRALSNGGLLATTLLSILSCVNLFSSEPRHKRVLTATALVANSCNSVVNLVATGILPHRDRRATDNAQHLYDAINEEFEGLAITLIRLNTIAPDLAREIASGMQCRAIRDAMLEHFLPEEQPDIKNFIESTWLNLWAAVRFVQMGALPPSSEQGLPQKPVSPNLVIAVRQQGQRSSMHISDRL